MKAISKFVFKIPSDKITEILEEFSFSLTKDFKKLGLDSDRLFKLIEEECMDIDTNMRGSLIFGGNDVGIRKIRLNKNNSGKSSGYRLIALVLNVKNTAYVLHIYSKSDKKKLTKNEKENLKTILKSFPK